MNIPFSDKHGVNPTIPKCFFCVEDKNEIILMGKLKNDVKAPRGMVFDQVPCDKCAGYMKQGVILISVDEEKTDDPKNPWRTGGWVVVTADAVSRMPFEDSSRKDILKKRAAFISDELWDLLGLPRGEIPERKEDKEC